MLKTHLKKSTYNLIAVILENIEPTSNINSFPFVNQYSNLEFVAFRKTELLKHNNLLIVILLNLLLQLIFQVNMDNIIIYNIYYYYYIIIILY